MDTQPGGEAAFIDLLHGIASARKGRPTSKIHSVSVTRELGPDDLKSYAEEPRLPVARPSLQNLKHSHHMIAQLLAEGRKIVEAAMITGYTPARIQMLKDSPMFVELVEHYKSQAAQRYFDVHERLAGLGMDAVDTLHERLGDNPDGFSNKQLLEVAEFSLDRSLTAAAGAGPRGNPGGGGGLQINVQFVSPGCTRTIDGQAQPADDGTSRPPAAQAQGPKTIEGERVLVTIDEPITV